MRVYWGEKLESIARKRVVHFSSVHPRYDVRVFDKEAASVAKHFETYLIVSDGKGDAESRGVKILDVGTPVNRLYRMLITTWLVFLRAFMLKADLYHFHDPELIPFGLMLRFFGKKVIFDMHENTDMQIIEKHWIPNFIRKPLAYFYMKFEKISCMFFNGIIVPQFCMKSKYNLDDKTFVVCNFPHNDYTIEVSPLRSKYELIYSGTISDARGFQNMLHLIEELGNLDSRYCLNIAGNLTESQSKRIEASEAKNNIRLLGYLSKDEMYQAYSKATFGLVLFNNVGQYGMAYALKLFEYMQNGLVVVMPNFGDWLTFNDEYIAGISIDPLDFKTIANTIYTMSEDKIQSISESNICLVTDKFCWSTQEENLLKMYRSVLNESKT